MEPRLRASPEQFSVLIDFMERHGDLSRPQQGLQGRLKSDYLWKKLTNILNSLGGGTQKSLDKWRKVWADWKTKTKKKSLHLRRQARDTGSLPSSRITLTALEERVVSVIRRTSIRKQGFNSTSSESIHDTRSAIDLLTLESDNMSEGHSQNIAVELPPVITCVPTTSLPQRQQASASPLSTSTNPGRILSRARRNRGLTPFERAADQFAAIEQRRLQHEEERDKRLHEREMERLRLEAERIEVSREQNALLHQLSLLGKQFIDVISNKHQPT